MWSKKMTTKMNKSVSIVMCTFNGERYVAQQLDTLLRQTYPVKEILVQDDHSTDGTMNILRRYAAESPLVKVRQNTSTQGFNGNFLSAFRQAEGEYIAVCDQDDLWEQEKIEKQMAAIGQHLLCVCRSKPFSEDGASVSFDPRTPNYHLVRLLYCSIPGHVMLFHRRLLGLLPAPNDSYKTNYDIYLSLTAASLGSLVLVDEVLVRQRRHADAATFIPADRRRTPSVGNGLYILRWSLLHFREMRPYVREFFQRRLNLMSQIQADSELFREALQIVRLESESGFGNLFRLALLHIRHRHHLFYTEGRGPVNLLRASLYWLMQVYNYQYLKTESHNA